ncbi:PREDICTED: auxin-responsive protein SAUR72-like [Tarenaya hassleriana]|uniref:auxin-responsive protein SAUR72-like n=1 Tax=Tarenaya hassleriana TaxID=28532 RepID=UPI0008FD2171|nr:PREDICTED: auxin-responsive protein SAUR72-like [Tarenaya hassleriana]
MKHLIRRLSRVADSAQYSLLRSDSRRSSRRTLNHPVFVGLLNQSAQEYGYEQKGVLHIPCHVLIFERIMESLRLGLAESRDLQDLMGDDAT